MPFRYPEKNKRTPRKSDDNIFEQFMNRYPISSERCVNREVTVSAQLEVGRESSGVALEGCCPRRALPCEPSSQNGSDSQGKDGILEAYITLYFSSGKPLKNEAYNGILALIATRRHISGQFIFVHLCVVVCVRFNIC